MNGMDNMKNPILELIPPKVNEWKWMIIVYEITTLFGIIFFWEYIHLGIYPFGKIWCL